MRAKNRTPASLKIWIIKEKPRKETEKLYRVGDSRLMQAETVKNCTKERLVIGSDFVERMYMT